MKMNCIYLVSFLLFVKLVDIDCLGQKDLKNQMNEGGEQPAIVSKPKGGKARQIQRAAIEAWGSSLLPEKDYNATQWTKMKGQPQYVFDHYAKKLSDIFLKTGATVNFALVGACDGTNDNTIRERFLPNAHWRALFVEPISINFLDLTNFLSHNNVSDRSHAIQAAVTNECASPTIIVKTPILDKATEDTKVPHWIRRQIGGIVEINPDTGKPRIPMNWKAEEVKCISGGDILKEWAAATSKSKPGKQRKASKAAQKRRPHVLKIDAEGHDYQVLASFLTNDTTNAELPLLINFEAKTMFEKYPLARAVLEKRGYAVSNFATDGFAMLKSEYFFKAKKSKKATA